MRWRIPFVLAMLVAAALLLAFWVFPPPPIPMNPRAAPVALQPTVAGAFHVHTTRSDGAGSPAAIADAAAAAGLRFVVFADHGDGTRPLEAPAYRSGVLCVDGVEISTMGGHYVALGLQPSPYPLGGDGRGVVEDVRRLGGFGIVAHPDSPKAELRWQAWDAPFDAMEWINADSEWRDEGWGSIIRTIVQYPFRRPQALLSLLDRPVETMRRWDALTRNRRVPVFAGNDAHGRIAWGGGDREDDVVIARLPPYAAAFGLFSNRVVLRAPFSGDAAKDAVLLLEALRGGHTYTVIDALAGSYSFTFRAESGLDTAIEGDRLPLGGPVRLEVAAHAPVNARTVLFKGSKVVSDTLGGALTFAAPAEPAVFRAEVHVPSAPGQPPVPWLVSNPIYVGGEDGRPGETAQTVATETRPLAGPTETWLVERDASSSGQVTVGLTGDRPTVAVDYTLGGGVAKAQYVAAVKPTPGGLAGFDRISFRVSASRPIRLSVQIRAADGSGRRWRRSFYADPSPADVRILLSEFAPVGDASGGAPDLAHVEAVLFVVDLTNNRPSASGRVSLESPALERVSRRF